MADHNHHQARLEAALARCASEAVHTPGAIQPGGCLLATDKAMQTVLQASNNLAHFLGIQADEALGVMPELVRTQILQPSLVEDVQASPNEWTVEAISLSVDGSKRHFQRSAWLCDERLVVELEPLPRLRQRRVLSLINHWLSSLAEEASRSALLNTLVRGVANLTGFAQVMVYHFDEQWNGTVIAEHCGREMTPLLEHRFPASDLPAQVRRLYETNPLRYIADVSADAVPLQTVRQEQAQAALDLSRGNLRAVSPVHLHYLRNMGVGASMSLAIHDGDRLWGLVACHHPRALPLSPALRDAALVLVQMASQRLFLLEAREQRRYALKVQEARMRLAPKAGQSFDPHTLVKDFAEHWTSLFSACGLAFSYDKNLLCHGQSPSASTTQQLLSRLTARHHDYDPWCSDRLGDSELADVDSLEGCAGLMALPLAETSPPAWLIFFREEQVMDIRWAGEPVKGLVMRDGLPALDPRRSFATWVETVRGSSKPWRPEEQRAAMSLAESLAIAISAHRISQLNEELSESNRHLAKMAHTDRLTGCWNRYFMEEELERELAAAERYQRPCSLLLFDVDHFKRFNDNHGHEAGDRVLKALADTVRQSLRSTDRLGRWGGEEFIVLAANSPLAAGVELAERLRRDSSALSLPGLEPITISIGVVEWQSGDSRKSLIQRADAAMYQAKQGGRNRVIQGG